MNKAFNNCNLLVEKVEFKKGDFVVLTDSYISEDEYNGSIFKVETASLTNSIIVEISEDYLKNTVNKLNNYQPKEKDTLIVNSNLLRKVNVDSLNMFKNYVINTCLIGDEGLIVNGGTVCAVKFFDIINDSKDMDDFISKVKSNNPELLSKSESTIDASSLGDLVYYYNEDYNNDFNAFKESYIETIDLLRNSDINKLLELYISDTIYQFSEFSLERDTHFLNSSIQDARNIKLA